MAYNIEPAKILTEIYLLQMDSAFEGAVEIAIIPLFPVCNFVARGNEYL